MKTKLTTHTVIDGHFPGKQTRTRTYPFRWMARLKAHFSYEWPEYGIGRYIWCEIDPA